MIQEYIKGICIVFYEALCCKLFLDVFMNHRYREKFINVISLVPLTVIFMFCVVNTYFQQQYILRSIIVIGSIVVFSLMFYRGNWLMRMFLGVCFYGIVICVDYLGIILSDFLLDSELMEKETVQIIIVLLCKSVLFLLVLLLGCAWKRKENILQMKNSEWILMLGFPCLTVGIMLLMLFSNQAGSSTAGYLAVSFGMFTMNVIMFLLMQYISAREKQLNQLQLLQERNKEKMQAYHELSASNEFQKRALHDYENQLNCIQGLLKEKQYDKVQEYTDKLTYSIRGGTDVVNVHNSVINVILNQKYHLAEERGIAILFEVNNLSKIWLEEQDLVILISNLFDNAIEACEKSEDKIIHIKLVKEQKEIVLSIKNTVGEPVDIESGLIHTSKKDKHKHGIGLRNVQMVLEKYDGIGMMRYEKGWFYYTAVISELDF